MNKGILEIKGKDIFIKKNMTCNNTSKCFWDTMPSPHINISTNIYAEICCTLTSIHLLLRVFNCRSRQRPCLLSSEQCIIWIRLPVSSYNMTYFNMLFVTMKCFAVTMRSTLLNQLVYYNSLLVLTKNNRQYLGDHSPNWIAFFKAFFLMLFLMY